MYHVMSSDMYRERAGGNGGRIFFWMKIGVNP